LLPRQGQSIVPSATWSTVQPWCVQTALKALNWPAVGWVTTTFSAEKTLPPPTGMSLVLAREPADDPPPDPPPDDDPPPEEDESEEDDEDEEESEDALLELDPPHAASTPAIPATPTPASTVRRPVPSEGVSSAIAPTSRFVCRTTVEHPPCAAL
jgi:hypothetical protein